MDEAVQMGGGLGVVGALTSSLVGITEAGVGAAGKISELNMPALAGIDFASLGRGITGAKSAPSHEVAPAAPVEMVAKQEVKQNDIHDMSLEHLSNLSPSFGGTTGGRGMGGIA